MLLIFNNKQIKSIECIFYKDSIYFQNSNQINSDYNEIYNTRSLSLLSRNDLIDYIIFMDLIINHKLMARSIVTYIKNYRSTTKKSITNIDFIDNFICESIRHYHLSDIIIKDYDFVDTIMNKSMYSYLLDNFGTLEKYFVHYNCRINRMLPLFFVASAYHKLDTVKWLYYNFKLEAYIYDALCIACNHNNKEVAEWLVILTNKYNLISENNKLKIEFKYSLLDQFEP